MNSQPTVYTANGKGQFACSAAAVLVFIVNADHEILLLSHPSRKGTWEVVNGALDAGETVLDAALRETYEEVGSDIKVRPLGTVHVYSFHYDEKVRYMLSICYLFAYEGGRICPGDDMAGSSYRWWSLAELANEGVIISVPPNRKWIIKRAIELYDLWKDGPDVELQPELDPRGENKYTSYL